MSETTYSSRLSLPSLWAGLPVSEKVLFGLFVLLKTALLFATPLTGDEAYFIVWGQDISLGYYDHPPAVGWVNYVLSLVADNLYWYRAFAFFSAALIAYLIFKLLTLKNEHDSKPAFYVAMAFFVSPVSLMFVINANDTVLVFFGLIGVFWFAKAMREQSWAFAVLAGVFLGMAFLSKYFAVFMLTGLLIFSVLNIRTYGWKLPLLAALIVLLFVGENIYFNLTHCWNNILFNFFSRTRDSEIDLNNVLMYLGMLVLMLSPLGVYYWVRYAKWNAGFSQKLAVYAGLPLLLVLVLVSFSNVIGLHWPLLSIPIIYLLYVTLPDAKLKGLYLFNAVSSLVIAVVLLGALPFLTQLLPDAHKSQAAIYTQTDKVCALLPREKMMFTLDYSSQSTLSYYCANDDIHVFMSTSKYGREDDKKVNYKSLDGQDLTIFVSKRKDLEKVASFFKDAKIEELKPVEGIVYYLVTGIGFDYATYRERILKPVYEQYYVAPEWLPKAECGFKRMYGFQ
ncbi:glycosyltransferase family 39 protein [Thiomicrorhabdus sp. ZW0627]|uniref:ArnT family glycosyltransferase n=1 Tax=Thiomicrorhabdus sp. ZW0627 TaxID=3039774 RepID=UPI002436EE9C|nr:glycosyltransferase family 39 protein [Thiomicrorhabdus sp. ZW0627]MDG6773955.1 glycosyltransferase family 39 protein [Thiomicrorhabdus sp. ZW0627]